jgi:hypothetical protein
VTRNDVRTRRLFALLREATISDRDERLRLFSWILCRPIHTTNELRDIELDTVLNVLSNWQREKQLVEQAKKYAEAPA